MLDELASKTVHEGEEGDSFKFVSHRARMPGEFDSRRDSHSAKFRQRPQIFVKLSFRELCDSKLFGLHPFDNMATALLVNIGHHEQKKKKTTSQLIKF